MDILRTRSKRTWRDTAWWQATWQSLISGVLMTALAFPVIVYLASRLVGQTHIIFDRSDILQELAKSGLLMMPYLWAYFFALERIARRRNQDYPLQLLPPVN